MSSLEEFASEKLAELERRMLCRTLIETARTDDIWAIRDGRRLLSFSCNDYLNLSHHRLVKDAAILAVARHGAGAGASRLVTGNHPLFAELEAKLAALKGTQAACVFGSGYLANAGIIPALIGASDLILVDELAHACIMAGARLSGARLLSFRHNDLGHVEALLSEHRGRHRHAMIATDGVFSMDGDLAPLHALAAIAERTDCWLLSDDAHGIGVIGQGRGSSFATGTKAAVPLQMGTLSKAIGGYGGYLCASRPVIALMKTRARTLIYSTGLPPASAAAAIAALDLIEAAPEYAALPVRKAQAFTRLLGLPEAQSPIVPIVVGDARAALRAQRLLEQEGFLIVAIRPPTVPPGTARLRIAFTALHPDGEIARLADIVAARILPAPRGGMTAYFVTATGTDIGKSFVAQGLIRALRSQGRAVDALKPVISGFDPASPSESDTGILLRALGRPITEAEIDHISVWRFFAPLSPDMAAAREGRAIDFDALVAFCRNRIAQHDGTLLIEGVGGVMAPLDAKHTVLDWMVALGLPILLVTGSYLGALSHTLTALGVLAGRGLTAHTVIVSETPDSTVGLRDTVVTIGRFTKAPVVALPRRSSDALGHPALAVLAACL